MSTDTKKAKPVSPAPAQAAIDPLRAAAGTPTTATSRDIIPWWVLVIIFAFVEAVIIWLMWTQFTDEWAIFRARTLQNKGQYAASVPYYQQLLTDPVKTANAKNPTYLAELANAYYNMGKYDEATKYYQAAQDNRTNVEAPDSDTPPEYGDFNTMMGVSSFKKGDLAGAEKYLKQGLAHDKLDKRANFTMGELEYKRGNYRQAATYFKVALSDPTYEKQVKEYYAKIEQQMFGKVGSELAGSSAQEGQTSGAAAAKAK